MESFALFRKSDKVIESASDVNPPAGEGKYPGHLVKTAVVILPFLLLFQQAFCQKNYLPGFVVLKGDTIEGFLDYRNWERNPDLISFKRSLEDKPSEYDPMDIRGFGVQDELYESAIVETEMSSIQLASLEVGSTADLKIQVDTVFLQVLLKGKVSLYFYLNSVGREQFYVNDGSSYALLIYKKYMMNDRGVSRIVENNKYLNQLAFYFRECPTIQSRLVAMRYGKSNMEKLFRYYYQCTRSTVEFEKKTERTIVEFGVVCGVSLTSLKFTGGHHLEKSDYHSSKDLSGGVSFDVILPRNRRKFSLYNELFFSSYHVSGGYTEYVNEDYYTRYKTTLGYTYLKLNNMFRYKYSVGTFFVYVNGGISNGFAISETNSLLQETVIYSTRTERESKSVQEARKYEQGYLVGLGAKLQRLSFEARYEKGNGMSPYSSLKTTTNRFYFLVGCKL